MPLQIKNENKVERIRRESAESIIETFQSLSFNPKKSKYVECIQT